MRPDAEEPRQVRSITGLPAGSAGPDLGHDPSGLVAELPGRSWLRPLRHSDSRPWVMPGRVHFNEHLSRFDLWNW